MGRYWELQVWEEKKGDKPAVLAVRKILDPRPKYESIALHQAADYCREINDRVRSLLKLEEGEERDILKYEIDTLNTQRLALAKAWERELHAKFEVIHGSYVWALVDHVPRELLVVEVKHDAFHVSDAPTYDLLKAVDAKLFCVESRKFNEGEGEMYSIHDVYLDRASCARRVRWSYDAQPVPEPEDQWDNATVRWDTFSSVSDQLPSVQWHLQLLECIDSGFKDRSLAQSLLEDLPVEEPPAKKRRASSCNSTPPRARV